MNVTNGYKLTKTSLKNLLQVRKIAAANERLETLSVPIPEREYTPIVGYHVYADLRLKLKITAGQDDDSRRYLRIIQDCVTAADKCSLLADAHLLEVQVDKLHFVIEATTVTGDSYSRLLAFCSAFAHQVFKTIIPRDRLAWEGFAMSADHGPAIIIHPEWDSSDSLVSLGVAANNPAKRLYQTPTVPSGNLAINENIWLVSNNDLTPKWKNLEIYSENGTSTFSADDGLKRQIHELNEKMLVALSNVFEESENQPLIKLSSSTDFLRQMAGDVNTPTRVQGFYFRADLDGFTSKVKTAFVSKTDAAIEDLVRDFYRAMEVAKHFQDKLALRKLDVLPLPWAGDCANMIIFPPQGQSYSSAQETVPFASPLAWHELEDVSAETDRKWAAAVGGGGTGEGSNGALLVAQIRANERTFLVAAGWGAKRSHDAQQSDGLRGTETAMHVEDVSGLNTQFRKAFVGDGIFRKATLEALRKVKGESTSNLANAKTLSVPTILTRIPAPKPHFML